MGCVGWILDGVNIQSEKDGRLGRFWVASKSWELSFGLGVQCKPSFWVLPCHCQSFFVPDTHQLWLGGGFLSIWLGTLRCPHVQRVAA